MKRKSVWEFYSGRKVSIVHSSISEKMCKSLLGCEVKFLQEIYDVVEIDTISDEVCSVCCMSKDHRLR